MIELPLPAVSETVLPAMRLLNASLSVTVIVEVDIPSATTEVGLATTLDATALTVPAFTVKLLLVAPVKPVDAALKVKVPAAVGFRLLKVAVPFTAATVSVELGSKAPPELIEIVTLAVLEVRLPNWS